MAKKEEGQKTLREMINACATLDNPMLSMIAEAAPSPSAAYTYVQDLGWSDATAQNARNIAKLKEAYPKEWNAIRKTSEVNPSYEQFLFEEAVSRTFRGETKWFQTKMRIGGEVFPCEYPGLLRHFTEFQSDGEGGEKCVTTFDSISDNFKEGIRPPNKDICFPKLFGESTIDSITCALTNNEVSGWYLIIRNHIGRNASPFSSWLTVNMESFVHRAGGFPQFYRKVEISKPIEGNGSVLGDRIMILFREDLGPSYSKERGRVTLERLVQVGPAERDRVTCAVLQGNYDIISQKQIRKTNNPELLPNIWVGKPTWKTSNRNYSMEETLKYLGPLMKKLMSGPDVIEFEKVAGFSVLRDEPKELLSLFFWELSKGEKNATR